MTKQYKIVANGVTEIVEADLVDFMPQTGQTVYKINNEIVHIAPASALVTTVNKVEFICKIFSDIEVVLSEYNCFPNRNPVIKEIEEKIQLIQLKYIAENENH